MPEILSAPRSSGGTKRGGTVTSAPRSSGGGSRPSGGKVTSAPRGSVSEQIARGQAGQAKQFTDAAARDTPGSPSPALTPLRIALDVASVPAYAIGQAILHPTDKRTWTASGLDIFRDEKRHVFPGQALRQRGALDAIPTKYGLRSAAAFVGDVALDPTTYLSFGGSTAAKTAGRAASEQLVARIDRGEKVTLHDVARASAAHAEARAAVPRAVSVGIQVPFTRAKRIVIAESDALPRMMDKLSSLIPERIKSAVERSITEPFTPHAGTDRVVHQIGNDVRGAASGAKRQASRYFTKQDHEFTKVAESLGMDRYQAYKDLRDAIEDPSLRDALPDQLKPFIPIARESVDTFKNSEFAAGVEHGLVPDYLTHRLLNAAERRKFERQYGPQAAYLDNPFFIKSRTFKTARQGEALGFKFEANPWRLLEIRAHASIDAISKKAIDDATAEIRGVSRATPGIPAVGKALSPGEWQALGHEWQAFPSKYLKDVKVNAETQRALQRVYEQITPSMLDQGQLAGMLRFMQTVTARWKALALANPGFHLRNQVDDSMRAWWAGGRNPKSYTDAYRLLVGKGKNITQAVDGHTLDSEQLLSLTRNLGVTDSGFSGREVASGLEETGGSIRSATQKVRAPGTGGVTQASRRFGDLRENAVRLGTFLERVKAGDHAMEAARVAKEFHMEYGDAGRFVEAARRFWLPFVTYTAKSLPLVGRQIARKPGTLANINKAMQALNQAGGAPDLSLLPTGQRSSFAVPLPEALRSLLGAKAGDPILYNPEKVFTFGTLNTVDPTQIQQQGLGLLSPFAKTAIEAPTGYRFYYAGQAASRVRAPWAVQQAARLPILASLLDYGPKHYRYKDQTVPGYGAVQDSLLQLFPPFGAAGRLTPAEGAQTVAPAVGSWLTGVRLSPYDYQRARYYSQQYRNR